MGQSVPLGKTLPYYNGREPPNDRRPPVCYTGERCYNGERRIASWRTSCAYRMYRAKVARGESRHRRKPCPLPSLGVALMKQWKAHHHRTRTECVGTLHVPGDRLPRLGETLRCHLDLLPTTKTKTKTKPPASSSDGRPSSVSKLDQTAFGSYCLTMDLRLSENTSGSDAAHALGPEAMQEYLFVRIMRLSGSNLRCTQQVFTTNHIHTVFCFHQLQISTTNPIGNLPLLLRTSNPPSSTHKCSLSLNVIGTAPPPPPPPPPPPNGTTCYALPSPRAGGRPHTYVWRWRSLTKTVASRARRCHAPPCTLRSPGPSCTRSCRTLPKACGWRLWPACCFRCKCGNRTPCPPNRRGSCCG